MKTVLLLLLTAMSLHAQYYNINIVSNGTGESGNLTGWDVPGGSHFASYTGESQLFSPVNWPTDPGGIPEGLRIIGCYTGGTLVTESISQTIDLSAIASDISSGGVKAELKGCVYKYENSATSRIILEELDALSVSLSSSQFENDNNNQWQEKTITINNLNPSARKLKITLYAVLNNVSMEIAAFDRIELKLSLPSVTFAGGSTFIQSITPNAANQVLGRFSLLSERSGPALTSATFKLNGTRTGLSNFKLWASGDDSFGGDIQLGSTAAADPGDGNSVTFNGFSNPIGTSNKYYFLTADVADGAVGTLGAVLVNNSSLTFSSCTFGSTISNTALSDNTAPLPVELVSFRADMSDDIVSLNWNTATEVNNYGFEVERKRSGAGKTGSEEDWEKIGFVRGNGTCNSQSIYSFTDNNPLPGKALYRLKQIDNDGQFRYYDALSVNVTAPAEYRLMQNSPNPFNPTTAIKFQLPESSPVTIRVYNITGREVATLVDEQKPAGSHIVYWNGRDSNGVSVSSGIYIYKLTAGNFAEVRKMNLLR